MRPARNRITAKTAQPREFLRRLDKVAGDLNIVLLLFVIGLATLDFTFLVTQKVVDNLPPATRIVHNYSQPTSLGNPPSHPNN
ncbi:MAG: hypothetical protein ACREFB_00560 [Stellaceae bacterium]